MYLFQAAQIDRLDSFAQPRQHDLSQEGSADAPFWDEEEGIASAKWIERSIFSDRGISMSPTEEPSLELGNIALAPEDVATLKMLVERYDRVIQELDVLNDEIESLLQAEGIKACES